MLDAPPLRTELARAARRRAAHRAAQLARVDPVLRPSGVPQVEPARRVDAAV